MNNDKQNIGMFPNRFKMTKHRRNIVNKILKGESGMPSEKVDMPMIGYGSMVVIEFMIQRARSEHNLPKEFADEMLAELRAAMSAIIRCAEGEGKVKSFDMAQQIAMGMYFNKPSIK